MLNTTTDFRINYDIGDIDLTNHGLSFVKNDDGLIQSINNSLLMRLGERIYFSELGLDLDMFLGSPYNERYVNLAVTRALEQNPKVLEVISVESYVDSLNDGTLNKIIYITIQLRLTNGNEITTLWEKVIGE